MKERLVGIGVVLGTVIGAGFLALPYAAGQAGIATVLALLALLAIVVITLHVAYADVVLSTPGQHRLPGYAYWHLGSWGKRLAGVSVLVGGLGNLLLYLIFGGSFIALFWHDNAIFLGTIVFWAVMTFLLLLKFSTSSLVDAAASWFLVGMLVVIAVIAAGRADPENLVLFATEASWVLPYGIVMFSLLGLAVVPELTALESLRARRALVPVLVVGIASAALLYAAFTIAVVGAVGAEVSTNALLSVFAILPEWARWILPMAGLLAIGTSYFIFGFSVRKVLELDFGVRPPVAFLIVAAVPLLLFLSGARDIAIIIGFLGGIWVSVDALLVFLMRERVLAEHKNLDAWRHKLIGRFLMLFFIAGTISSIIMLAR